MQTRRFLLSAFIAAPALIPGIARSRGEAPSMTLTPACADDDDLTISQTEGPYFKRNSPEKRDFVSDAGKGEPMTVAGFVLSENCRSVRDALIELWHADSDGDYDNSGYRLRGHQFTDAEGRWWFNTIVPGLYPGRTRHFHLKVQRPGGKVLTTQLYFPGERGNDTDRIFNRSLLLDITSSGDGKFGRYDFVIG